MKNNVFAMLLISSLAFTACDKDDDVNTNQFTVTIENIMEGKDYFDSGETGFLMPGESATFNFNAGPGHYLNLATMYVQSNDLFVAADSDMGIALYNGSGTALSGDITNLFTLWDAGTEVNEEPGIGPNQAPRQAGPNTGTTENGTVRKIADVNDGFTYPSTSELVKITLNHDGGTGFELTLENISGSSAIPSPFAPGVWVIHGSGATPLFSENQASSSGLEGLAEDGNIEMLSNDISDNTGFVSPFAPGGYSIGQNNEVFNLGGTASSALEAMAEDGDASGYPMHFNTPDGASGPGPIFPGGSYSFSFDAEEGDKFSLGLMLVQSNDWFAGVNEIDLYENGAAISGNISSSLNIYDAGTEVDEYAGAGLYQAPRQPGANTGMDENGIVEVEANVGSHVPAVSAMLRVTISNQ